MQAAQLAAAAAAAAGVPFSASAAGRLQAAAPAQGQAQDYMPPQVVRSLGLMRSLTDLNLSRCDPACTSKERRFRHLCMHLIRVCLKCFIYWLYRVCLHVRVLVRLGRRPLRGSDVTVIGSLPHLTRLVAIDCNVPDSAIAYVSKHMQSLAVQR